MEPDGRPLDESAWAPRLDVGTDEVYLPGGDRALSNDSRRMGSIPRSAIVGRSLPGPLLRK